MTESNNVYKAVWKNSIKSFLRNYLLRNYGRVLLLHTSVCFAISKLTLSFSYSFHVQLFINISCFLFFLIDRNWKQVLFIKWVIYFSLKFNHRSDKRTNCWNVQTAEKQNLCAWSNIIYIKFQSCSFSVSSLGGVPKVHTN